MYAMRDKLVGGLRPYVEGEEAEVFGKRLTAAEDWCVFSFLFSQFCSFCPFSSRVI